MKTETTQMISRFLHTPQVWFTRHETREPACAPRDDFLLVQFWPQAQTEVPRLARHGIMPAMRKFQTGDLP